MLMVAIVSSTVAVVSPPLDGAVSPKALPTASTAACIMNCFAVVCCGVFVLGGPAVVYLRVVYDEQVRMDVRGRKAGWFG